MDNTASNPKQALVDKIKQSTNILVTVSANPSVDQLAACLGLTLWLNKLDKHATAVFSGDVPSTLEFLEPEETLEKNTDSLRDFIISLDKSKADKLRYKVEDAVVKIFITPYRTSLSADDLEYSQGDFNVDMVIALGVSAQQDLDTAITAHGRILHDATVASINTTAGSELGSIHWQEEQASSLSELMVELGNELQKDKLDNQIATALLTGIVAETERFSNAKTAPQTMNISAQLMSAGANQQLVASKLEEPAPAVTPPVEAPAENSNDGSMAIDHEADVSLPAPEEPAATNDDAGVASRFITEPPSRGGTLTANSQPDDIMLEPSSDPLSQPAEDTDQPPLLGRQVDETPPAEVEQPAEPAAPAADMQPPPPDWMPPQPWMDQPAPEQTAEQPAPVAEPFMPKPDETLAEIEVEVDSPHLKQNIDSARDEVMKAIEDAPNPPAPEPVQALNAQPIDLNPAMPPATAFDPASFGVAPEPAPAAEPVSVDPDLTTPVEQPYTLPLPGSLTPPPANPVPPTSAPDDPTAPPPVPPPMTFPPTS